MKKLSLAFLALVAGCQSPHNDNDALVRHTQTYMNYISDLSHVPADDFHKVPHPFHSECHKTLNDILVAESAESFVNQLRDVRIANKGWTIETIGIYPSDETQSATVIYDIHADPMGSFHVIKLIRFDADVKITSVHENFVPKN